MPRMKNETRELIDVLKSLIERNVTEAVTAGRTQELAEMRTLVGGVPTVKRGPGRPPKNAGGGGGGSSAPSKPRKRRRNPWAHMTADQRAERVRKMLAGRGLKPKSER